MEQNKVQATTGITFRILVALSICHCLNDTLQSVIFSTSDIPKYKRV